MRKALRILGVGAGVLVALVAVAAVIVYGVSQRRIRATMDVVGHAVVAPSDSATIARGRHVATAIGMCGDCHGPDLGGQMMIDDPSFARLYAANLTGGDGGTRIRTEAEWERAIRHGIAPDGRKLLFMPAQDYTRLNDDDLAALIAYLRQLPPVSRPPVRASVGPIARVLLLTGALPLLPADLIDHAAAHPAAIAPAATADYGAYAANTCRGCHGATLAGGPMPGAPPEWKPPANLTPTGIGHYAEADFFRVLREGRRPDGSQVDTTQMPVRFTRLLSDDEVRAIYAYLRTVPPKAYGEK